MIKALKKIFGISRKRKQVLVLGDSHTRIFKEPEAEGLFPGYELRVVMVGGATASGLANPNSQTQAYPIFKGVLEKSNPSVIVIQLGEVDTGFVIWYRSRKRSVPIARMLHEAVDAYCSFLSEASAKAPVVCMSAPLPTIVDGNDWGEVANLRKDIDASQKLRTQMTLDFNRLVGEYCRMRHIRHVNLDDVSIGQNGLVSTFLLNEDEADHHYDKVAYLNLIRDHVVDVVMETAR